MSPIALPERIFFTGVPGSRWSGISQSLEQMEYINTSDQNPQREYKHEKYGGHHGIYFGHSMELNSYLDKEYIDQAWTEPGGTKIVKSHEWAYKLHNIKSDFPDDWIMLVYRPDMASYTWWLEAGGFNIKYPDYSSYEDGPGMLASIGNQNRRILKFACEHDLQWSYFTSKWVEKNFGQTIEIKETWNDILVTLLK
jgi:hypothetical protein